MSPVTLCMKLFSAACVKEEVCEPFMNNGPGGSDEHLVVEPWLNMGLQPGTMCSDGRQRWWPGHTGTQNHNLVLCLSLLESVDIFLYLFHVGHSLSLFRPENVLTRKSGLFNLIHHVQTLSEQSNGCLTYFIELFSHIYRSLDIFA
ncbi:hypothetical protein XENOCAPTIV_014367 [Xenoophorus captivus]|uniref:Uncharacterized protein n=1 Tax=Xenoophorus captivus TaxID=1517983 RepID=A0ABV0RQN3_9TELE